MCKPNDHFHEDFGDEPSVEERYPFDQEPERFEGDGYSDAFLDDDEDFDDEDFDAELAADLILERQELEDFEGHGFHDFDVGGEGGEW
jgi:hypothetical protein